MGFRSYSERSKLLDEHIQNLGKPIPYGNPFLDEALGGIYPDDLIVMSAKTGGGKTEFASSIAHNAASMGHRVHVFALEAHVGEYEARMRFKALASAFFIAESARTEYPDYQQWIQGKQDHLLKKYEPEVKEILERELETLSTFYTDKDFNADSFESYMYRIGEETDLVIVDHLHYFDLDGKDQNAELKKTVKQIKNIVSFYRKPAIILAQLRKSERYSEQLLPEVDDIHGSSDIAKIATKIIVTAPAKNTEIDEKNVFPTFIRIVKNRTAGNRTYFTALCGYDAHKNQYRKNYFLGTLTDNGTTFEKVSRLEYPQWATCTMIT